MRKGAQHPGKSPMFWAKRCKTAQNGEYLSHTLRHPNTERTFLSLRQNRPKTVQKGAESEHKTVEKGAETG